MLKWVIDFEVLYSNLVIYEYLHWHTDQTYATYIFEVSGNEKRILVESLKANEWNYEKIILMTCVVKKEALLLLLLLLSLQRQRSTKGLPLQHPFRVGGKDLEEWRRASKGIMSSCIEPGAPP